MLSTPWLAAIEHFVFSKLMPYLALHILHLPFLALSSPFTRAILA
ncbi:hypothetical protein [Piscirickettsia salmonis]|nr:hypothetical protein [Piscirickettsia salmonis]